ncbi:hypothetical protein P5673_020162 [Acropora cervicornis]|uniref:Uncharacterized protein n=1 Tax=Acropora cervicornis TaxID=6130 RepID=A0AAD9QAN3_ACRCE|nr:hypothetical protein P5673_020162 [Acropora cervicornis]
MWNAAHNCTWPIAGGVRAWSSFLQGTKGKVEKRFITHCKGFQYLYSEMIIKRTGTSQPNELNLIGFL